VENPLAFLLRHASEYSKHFAPALFFLELLQAVKYFLLGFVADAAGVIKKQVRLFRRGHLPVAFRNQGAYHFLGVVRIHLAPEGLDIEALHSARFYCNEVAMPGSLAREMVLLEPR